MWGIPSGNHILWIRPTWQDATTRPLGNWGDYDQPAEPSWPSISWDPNNSLWVARRNPDAVRTLLGAVTGTGQKEGADLVLYRSSVKTIIFANYQWGLEAVAKHRGNGFRGEMTGSNGSSYYSQRTRYVRQLDMSLLTPDERLAEMVDAVVNDEEFGKYLVNEFGLLGRAEVLVAMCAVLAIFAGVVGGAAVIGGAAFAAALSRLIGFAMVAYQIKVYVDEFEKLRTACFSGDQADFERGKDAVRKLVRQMLMDIAMILGLKGAMALGGKAVAVLKTVFTKFTPKAWQEAAAESVVQAKSKVQAMTAACRFAREDLMSRVANPASVFRRGEDAVFRARSAANGEMIAIRGPSPQRLEWLKKLNGWLDGKPEWVKVKSWMGWHGLVGFPKTPEIEAIVQTGARGTYPMGNLKGVFAEVDAYIAKNPTRPCYEVPYGKNFVDPVKGKKCFDWDAAGANYSLARGAKLVDIGDRYILVDALGRPICQDLDLAALYKLGTPSPGAHLPAPVQGPKVQPKVGNAVMPNPEDWFAGEEMLNYQIYQATGQMAGMMKHGGRGGSMRHIVENTSNGKPFWSPLEKDGTWLDEPLYVYLPTGNALHKSSELYMFRGWAEFEQFCDANHFAVGFKELRAALKAGK